MIEVGVKFCPKLPITPESPENLCLLHLLLPTPAGGSSSLIDRFGFWTIWYFRDLDSHQQLTGGASGRCSLDEKHWHIQLRLAPGDFYHDLPPFSFVINMASIQYHDQVHAYYHWPTCSKRYSIANDQSWHVPDADPPWHALVPRYCRPQAHDHQLLWQVDKMIISEHCGWKNLCEGCSFLDVSNRKKDPKNSKSLKKSKKSKRFRKC